MDIYCDGKGCIKKELCWTHFKPNDPTKEIKHITFDRNCKNFDPIKPAPPYNKGK